MEERELYLRVDGEEDDREISLLLLILDIFKKWKLMLVCGLLCAACFIGLKFYKDLNSYNYFEEESTTDALEDNLTSDESSNISTYISMFEKLNVLQSERAERLLYQLDPYNKKVLYLTYVVSLLDDNDSGDVGIEIAEHLTDERIMDQISAVYSKHMQSEDIVSAINEATKDVEERDLRQLISSSYSSGVLSIFITYTDDMDIEAISETVKNNLEQFSKEQQSIAKHSLTLIDETYETITDNDLANTQVNMSTQIYNLQNQLNNLENNFDDAEKEYIQTYFNERGQDDAEAEASQTLVSEKEKPHISKKWAVVGFIFGVFIVCAWELMRYLFSGKLHSSEDISDYYRLKVFGIQSLGEKKVPKGIDKLIYNIENRNRKILAPDEQKEIILSGIRIHCQQNDLKEIVLTGTDIENLDEAYLDEIKSALSKDGIKAVVEKNFYYYPEALQRCVKVPNAVIFETVEASIDKEIENLLVKAKEYNINVLGAVVIQ